MWSRRSRVAATPLFPSPTTATSRPVARQSSSSGTAVTSAYLERAQRHQRAEKPEDIEPRYHGGLGPAQFLEVVVQWRHAEHPVSVGVLPSAGALVPLVRAGLDQHGDGFRGEDSADQQQQELRLEQNGHRAERAADGEAAG